MDGNEASDSEKTCSESLDNDSDVIGNYMKTLHSSFRAARTSSFADLHPAFYDGSSANVDGRESYMNIVFVVDNISVPENSFDVHGYVELWWKKLPYEKDWITFPVEKWTPDDVETWFKHKFDDYSNMHQERTELRRRNLSDSTRCEDAILESIVKNKKKSNVTSQQIHDQMKAWGAIVHEEFINGETFKRMDGEDLHNQGVTMLGAQQKLIAWRDELLETEKEYDKKHTLAHENPIDWHDVVYNSFLEEIQGDVSHHLLRDPESKKKDVVKTQFACNLTCTERMELANFPFDRQCLDIRLKVNKKFKMVKAKPAWVLSSSRLHLVSFNPETAELEPLECMCQIRLSEKVEVEYKMYNPILDFDSVRGAINVKIRVERKVGYYNHQVLLPVFLIVLCSFIHYYVEFADDFAERVGVIVTFFLVLVAYQYVVANMLPKSSFATYLDVYIVFSFIFMAIIVGSNAVVWHMPEERQEEWSDGFRNILFSFWLLLHFILYFFGCQLFRYSWEHTLNEDDETEYWLPRKGQGDIFGLNTVTNDKISYKLFDRNGKTKDWGELENDALNKEEALAMKRLLSVDRGEAGTPGSTKTALCSPRSSYSRIARITKGTEGETPVE